MEFSAEVSKKLRYYVYRLIDPRNGETFYVGKGKGNRVFSHAKGTLDASEEDISEKLKRVRDIISSGFEVSHIIHRHDLDEKTAFEVEGALIDAFPNTTNISNGHLNSEKGAMHAKQVIEKFSARTAVFKHKGIAITINRSVTQQSIYNAVRYAWKLSKQNAEKQQYVFAIQNGLIIEVFEPNKWMEATTENFPGTEFPREGRIGFEGTLATQEIRDFYIRCKLPENLRKKGAANPVRYVGKKLVS